MAAALPFWLLSNPIGWKVEDNGLEPMTFTLPV